LYPFHSTKDCSQAGEDLEEDDEDGPDRDEEAAAEASRQRYTRPSGNV